MRSTRSARRSERNAKEYQLCLNRYEKAKKEKKAGKQDEEENMIDEMLGLESDGEEVDVEKEEESDKGCRVCGC